MDSVLISDLCLRLDPPFYCILLLFLQRILRVLGRWSLRRVIACHSLLSLRRRNRFLPSYHLRHLALLTQGLTPVGVYFYLLR